MPGFALSDRIPFISAYSQALADSCRWRIAQRRAHLESGENWLWRRDPDDERALEIRLRRAHG